MKTKIFIILSIFVLACFFQNTYAQQMDTIYLTGVNSGSNFFFCENETDSVIVYKPDGSVGAFYSPLVGYLETDSVIISPDLSGMWRWQTLGQTIEFYVYFQSIAPITPWDETEIYKCTESAVALNAQEVHQNDFTYLWNTEATSRIIYASEPGEYIVTISGVCGEISDTITVINHPVPAPNLGEDMENVCNWDHQTLSPGEFDGYLWSTEETEHEITVSQTGTYSVTVTDTNGCQNSDEVNVHFYVNPGIQISTITVDTTNGNNKVTWNTNIPDFDGNFVKIYRNGATNEMSLLDSVPYNNGSFTDTENSSQRTWRYNITAEDNCGNYSDPSLYHESMKISLIGLIGNGIQIEWTPYIVEGGGTKQINSYRIFSVEGYGASWETTEITTVPGTQTSYNLPPTNDSLYVVGAILNSGGKNPGETMALAIMENPTVTRTLLLEDVKFALYPNPSTGPVNINGVGKLQIINSLGQIVLYDNINGETTISLPKGVYVVRLTNNTIDTKKLIIE